MQSNTDLFSVNMPFLLKIKIYVELCILVGGEIHSKQNEQSFNYVHICIDVIWLFFKVPAFFLKNSM